MTFNNPLFIFVYLPITLLGFALLGRFGRRPAIGWLALASIAFYAKWKLSFVFLLLASIAVNFTFSHLIARAKPRPRLQHWFLIAGVAANLGLLCFFKYLFPSLAFLHAHGLLRHDFGAVILPLGISFFTFTQLAYLIDLKQGQAEPQSLTSFALFVTFFPHLVAGPILHHKEIMPQFSEERRYGLRADDFALGLTWFILGLFKKVMIADFIAPYASALYSAPHAAGLFAAWQGAVFYMLQLYFDFSGYSDMALGLARMFSIRFPYNFNSPFKAPNIIDFWQRWHMTLSRYLTLYLYTPISLALTRRRVLRGGSIGKKALATIGGFLSLIAFPTLVTMFLAGVWHGAGMQFLVFGLIHGAYLCINHAWRIWIPADSRLNRLLPKPICVLITFVSVTVAFVFFRAASLADALTVTAALFGRHGLGAALAPAPLLLLAALLASIWLLPNTQEILGQSQSHRDESAWSLLPRLRWQPNLLWGSATAAAFLLSLVYTNAASVFLYFQF